MDQVPPPASQYYHKEVQNISPNLKKVKKSVEKYKRIISPLNNALGDLIEALKMDKADYESVKLIERIMELRKDIVTFFEMDDIESNKEIL